jgi:hypothetical protein
MLIADFCNPARGAAIGGALVALVLAMPASSAAQDAQPAAQTASDAQAASDAQERTTATADAQTGVQTPLPGTVATVPSRETRPPRWELVGGFESDSHDTSYGFIGPSYHRPLSDNLSLKFRVHATHLRYEFENDLGGETRVSAPGVGPGIGLRYGRKNWVQFTTGVDVKRERREITGAGGLIATERDTRYGLGVGADAWLTPTRRSNVHAMLHYGAASKYTWGRLAARHQVTNMDWHGRHTLYLGAEGVGQGNEDIRSWQLGPIAELVFARTQLSLQVRGGYKRSSFDRGPDKDGPYFGVGLWKRFGD